MQITFSWSVTLALCMHFLNLSAIIIYVGADNVHFPSILVCGVMQIMWPTSQADIEKTPNFSMTPGTCCI